MFIDARTLPNRTAIETDLAIIGAGPAGITLAREFAGRNLSVHLIESGGFEGDPDVQALYEGESTGIEYSLIGNRLRQFGGSSNHWGGYCRPLDEIDFERRDWLPFSGWPFPRSELAGYYDQAAERVEIAPGKFTDETYWREKSGEQLLSLATGRLEIQFVHYSPPTRFGQRYRDDLERAGNITTLLNANVTNLAGQQNGRDVKHLDIATLTGLRHTLKARAYVLATGAVENARILLLSRDHNSRGLGNAHDLVGRFFMEHPHVSGFGEIVMTDKSRLPRIYRERVKADNRGAQVAFKPSAKFMREKKLLNATFQMGVAGAYRAENARPHGDPQRAADHVDMLQASRRLLTDGATVLDSDDPSYSGVWLGLGSSCEQAPNPDSRVTLSGTKDALGLQRVRLDWRLTEQDRRSYVAHVRSLAQEFGALGLGRMKIDIEDDGKWPRRVDGGSHHMGTTRMSDDPRSGVVDRNCRVHGIDNLYVAGSSVFPTSGTANPTLTLVALALRLADHLKGKLA